MDQPNKIVMQNPAKLTPYAKNAKVHKQQDIDRLAGQIAAFGFDQPILVDTKGVIIKGHKRREAAMQLGLKKVPTLVSERDEYDNMANRLADNAVFGKEYNDDMVQFELGTLKHHNYDLNLTGYDTGDLERHLAQLGQEFSEGMQQSDGLDEQDDAGENLADNSLPDAILRAEFTQAEDAKQAMLDVAERRTSHACLFGECLRLLHAPSASVAMWFCDLPYGVTANAWDCELDLDALWRVVLPSMSRTGIVAMTATMGFGCTLVQSQRQLFRYDLVWRKNQMAGFINANKMPMREHENILIFYKDAPIYRPQKIQGKPYSRKHTGNAPSSNYGGAQASAGVRNYDGMRHPGSVIDAPVVSRNGQEHPTQKPLSLLEWLIRTYTNPGDLVVDPTMGSGTTGAACATTGRRFIGCEMNQQYYEGACERIAKAYKDGIDPLKEQAIDEEIQAV